MEQARARKRKGRITAECPSAPTETPNASKRQIEIIKSMLYGTDNHHHDIIRGLIDPVTPSVFTYPPSYNRPRSRETH
jgi:hypothetical protein